MPTLARYRLREVIAVLTVLLATALNVRGITEYHPSSAPKVRGTTADFPTTNPPGWWQSYNFSLTPLNPPMWKMTVASRVWAVSSPYGVTCVDFAKQVCPLLGQCSGPGEDIWVYGETYGADFAWITTKHKYWELEILPGQTFYTAAIYPQFANNFYWKGEGQNPVNCPPDNNVFF